MCVCGSTASNSYQMTLFEPIIIRTNLKDPHSNFWFFQINKLKLHIMIIV